MGHIVIADLELSPDGLAVIPMGGQSELGRMLWVITYGSDILLVDAGASYPAEDLPGVDLLLPNTNFLEANKSRIQALLLTNGHEEHLGAVPYLLKHLPIAKIMGPRFVCAYLNQSKQIAGYRKLGNQIEIDRIEPRAVYNIGPFTVEWIQVNDAIADACALRIGTPVGDIVYTSSFKLDQTPVDKRLFDVGRLAEIGENGVLLLLSASAGVESAGYTASEKSVQPALAAKIAKAEGRVIVVIPGTNTHRLKVLFDIAHKYGRKVHLIGEVLIEGAIAAAITGNLEYDRAVEAQADEWSTLPDSEVLIVATGVEGDAVKMLAQLASASSPEFKSKAGDLIIFSAGIQPGQSRHLADILDQFLAQNVAVVYGEREGMHVPKHASREELKLMLSLTNPKYFVPTFGEGRHIMHHAQLAVEWGMDPEAVFPLKNGDILEIAKGAACIIGTLEAQAVFLNRDQDERVTTASVKERQILSNDGVVTISLVIDHLARLLSGPVIDAGASAFLNSQEWRDLLPELSQTIKNHVDNPPPPKEQGQRRALGKPDINQMRAQLREIVTKMLKAKLQSKPSVQLIVQQMPDMGSQA